MSELPQGHALVIGINDYRGGISPLQSAAKDATAIAAALGTAHDYDVTCLVDAAANRDAIYEQIETVLPGKLGEDGAFLLYFAGHGVARGDGSEGPRGFLLPQDSLPADQDSWLSMERIRKALESYPNRHMLIILDCCFAGSFRWASTREAIFGAQPLYESQYQRYLNGFAWQVLTSASHDQRAMDVSPGRDNTRDSASTDGHSPFAAALLEGLAGSADTSQGRHDPDGVITATELYQYAFNELVPPDAETFQTPGIWPLRPDNEGQYIFLNPEQPRKTVPDPPLDDSNNPWLGLTAYGEEDESLFFGRSRVISEIADQVLDPDVPRFTAIVGASGTGKSSVAKAGVLPRLRNEHDWVIVQAARLGSYPLRTLDAALAELGTAGPRRLIFIDQFEELYTLCHDAERRSAFLDKLRRILDDDESLHVIVTLRSDFEPRAAGCDALGDLWGDGRYVVPAFTSEEFREIIEGPAQARALYFDPESITGELIDEVMAMPGALPMLSFALAEMYRRAQFRRRETGSNDRALTRDDYETIGGVVGSLHRRATSLFEEADPETQNSIKRVFLRMLSQDGARLARRRVELRELQYADADEQARVDGVIRNYVDARLLVVGSDEIEPAHDTLIVAWEKLLDWLSESGPQSLLRALWRAATDWDGSNRDKGLSWHDDPRLPLALTKGEELNKLEQTFVHASEKQRKGLRKRRIGIAAAVILVLGAIGLVAYDQLLEADFQAEEARWARETRDQTYLDIMEAGDFFKLTDVIGPEAQAGVVIASDEWRTLVDESEGTFVAARTAGEGRIMAIAHEALLVYVDQYDESLFLDLALYWLAADLGPSLYFTSGHDETLPVYEAQRYAALRERLLEYGYDFDAEDLPLADAVDMASVIIVGNAWTDISNEDIDLIEQFVNNGGGLLVAGLGWSFIQYGPHGLGFNCGALDVYPMNRLMNPFELMWTDVPIRAANEQSLPVPQSQCLAGNPFLN